MCLEILNNKEIKDEVLSNRLMLMNSVRKAEKELRLFRDWIREKKRDKDNKEDNNETKRKRI